MDDMEDHPYSAYQTHQYHDGTYQGIYQDGAYQNEGPDPVMPQTGGMEGDDAEEEEREQPRKQKERRRELEDDDEEDEDEDEEEEEDDDEDPGRKKKRTKVRSFCASIYVSNLTTTFVCSIATNGLSLVVSSILKLKSATKTKTRKTRKTLGEVR